MSKIKGTTAYGRRTILVMDNTNATVERKMSGNLGKQREAAYRLASRIIPGDQ